MWTWQELPRQRFNSPGMARELAHPYRTAISLYHANLPLVCRGYPASLRFVLPIRDSAVGRFLVVFLLNYWYHRDMALLQVIVSPEQIKHLKQVALNRDINVSELVREWIEEIE